MTASNILEIRDYILARVQVMECGHGTPCWVWRGSKGGGGYAKGRPPPAGGKSRIMSRVSYEAYVGPIPDGLQIDHLCRNKPCVNPGHLEVVTAAENARRKWWKRTVCLHGHPFEAGNIKIYADGRRRCLTCHEAWWAAKREVYKEERRVRARQRRAA